MGLDSRIKEGKRPLTCFDEEQAKEFLGKECYFSNCKSHYKNLSAFEKYVSLTDHCIGTLTAVMDLGDRVFDVDQQCNEFRYCLPCEWVKEHEPLEFVPYTLDTWEQEFKTGDVVFFKGKEDTWKDKNYYKCMYLGHLENEKNRILVVLGCWLFAFDELIDSFEIYRNGTWEPFGRKVEPKCYLKNKEC